LSLSAIETLVRTTSKRDAEKIDRVAAATVKIRTPEVQHQNLDIVGLHVVMACEAVVYEEFWQERWGMDQIRKEERFVSRASDRVCLGLAEILAAGVKEILNFQESRLLRS
jgi:hypothetical protein